MKCIKKSKISPACTVQRRCVEKGRIRRDGHGRVRQKSDPEETWYHIKCS